MHVHEETLLETLPIYYTGGALAPDYPHYICRSADSVAWRAVQQGRLIYAAAPRQMGKTSLMKRIASGLERQQWRCCFIDLATLRRLERPRWYRALGERIAMACALKVIRSPLRDQQDFRMFLLNEVGLARSDAPVRLGLFFDEVEGLLDLEFSDDFLMTLRDLYQQRDSYPGQFVASFAGAVDPQILVRDTTISPFNIAEEIVLHDLSAGESAQLTGKLALLGVPVEEDVHGCIYGWAGGHPYLTQRICELVEQLVREGGAPAVTSALIDRSVQARLLAPGAQDKNIRHIVQNVTRPAVTALPLWQHLMANREVSSSEAGFFSLYLAGLVTEDAAGRVTLRNRLYREVLCRQSSAPAAPGGGVVQRGKTWAVLAGVNRYDDLQISDLRVCADDVTAVRDMLGDTNVMLLLTEQAGKPPTRAQILGALATVAESAGPDDLLTFYFSGHGLAQNGEGYLLPCDARISAIRHTALAVRDVREILNRSAARAKLVILDACHSGAVIGKGSAAMSPEFLERVFAQAEGMAVLASCKHGQYSWEWAEQRRSVFTYYLLEAMAGKADFEDKGFVTISDASRYVVDNVKRWAAERGLLQTPTLQYESAGDIVVRRYR
jgi:hypothetical protein